MQNLLARRKNEKKRRKNSFPSRFEISLLGTRAPCRCTLIHFYATPLSLYIIYRLSFVKVCTRAKFSVRRYDDASCVYTAENKKHYKFTGEWADLYRLAPPGLFLVKNTVQTRWFLRVWIYSCRLNTSHLTEFMVYCIRGQIIIHWSGRKRRLQQCLTAWSTMRIWPPAVSLSGWQRRRPERRRSHHHPFTNHLLF